MNSSNFEPSTFLNRIIDKAADNLRIAKILVQLGLDPDNITYDAIFNRLLEIFLANITIANACALVGATFFVATLLTRTMVPLRVSNMISNVFFMAFGALASDIKTFLLSLLLLPINAIRLRQMLNLVKKARSAARGQTSMEWLKPFMTQRKYRQGEILCKKGDVANEMFLTVSGKLLVRRSTVAAQLLLASAGTTRRLRACSLPARRSRGRQYRARSGRARSRPQGTGGRIVPQRRRPLRRLRRRSKLRRRAANGGRLPPPPRQDRSPKAVLKALRTSSDNFLGRDRAVGVSRARGS